MKALVVTKEPALARQVVDVLERRSFSCNVVEASTAASRDEVLRLLATTRFELVVAQQRMSPYSASEVLQDVNASDGTLRPAVVCLAHDASDRNTFIRRGGAGFIVVEPGKVDLEEGFRQVERYRRDQSTNKSKVLRTIAEFAREDVFQLFILEVFEELNYSGIRRTHGPGEMGRDIVCCEVNRLNRKEYVGVQIKLGDIHGSGGTSGITELWRQAMEAFASRVSFDEGERYLDKFVIIASGRINESARAKLTEFTISGHSHRRIFFLDREELADLIVTSCPALLARIE
jgi:CheY-like chemotaxis protein